MPYVIMSSFTGRGREREWEFTNLTYEDGAEAGAYVKTQNSYYNAIGHRQMLKAVKVGLHDPRLWRERLKTQIESGELTPCPWHDDKDYKRCFWSPQGSGLFEHIDPDDPTKVRFIASREDGIADRFTSMNPGRFLKRYIGELPANKIETWCAKMGLDITTSPLLIATTPEDIVRVYNDGPHSCMSYEWEKGCGPFHKIDRHPVEVYGNSDIAIAYIERLGDIKARCIVRPEKKIFGRIYGDRDRLLERLRENDYIEDWDGFAGAKIRQLHTQSDRPRLILPYIDGDILGVDKLGDEWLVLSHKPHIIAKSPYGLPTTTKCMSCGAERTLHGVKDEDYDDELQYICAEGC